MQLLSRLNLLQLQWKLLLQLCLQCHQQWFHNLTFGFAITHLVLCILPATVTSTSTLDAGTWGGMWGSGLVGLVQVCVEWVEWVGVTQVGADPHELEWVVYVRCCCCSSFRVRFGWFVRSTRCEWLMLVESSTTRVRLRFAKRSTCTRSVRLSLVERSTRRVRLSCFDYSTRCVWLSCFD